MRAWKQIKSGLSLITVLAMTLSMVSPVLAVSYSAATTISESVTASDQTYSSTTALENAILVTAGTSTLTNPTVTKSGSPSGSSDDYDFYGTNAAIVATGGTLNLSGGTVTTSGAYANAVYAHDAGVINVTGTEITTSAHNSGGVMVTGGGTLNATNVTVTTSEGSSAAIRSDRGGGTLTVEGGTFTTSGQGSPAIYSTADISVKNATLTSTHSEGVVVEGGNSVALDGVTLTDTNDTLNGKSTTYKNIFLYQSMSGDASSGSSTFSAADSSITTNNGDTFYATNITTTITLENNTITNNNSDSSNGGYFLRAQADSWGTSGSNGGNVTLNLSNQTAEGDIYIDSVSTLTMNLSSGSSYAGTINGGNTASSIALTLDADSALSLTGDSYVTSLTNSDSANSNITLNGYSLYVNGTAITVSDSGTSDDNGTSDDTGTSDDSGTSVDDSSGTDSYNLSENPAITISSDGSYTITGSNADGCITVDSGVTATLTLSDVTLTSVTTGYAPVICKKNSNVTLVVDGTVTLTDNEDPSDTNSEGAAIKVKSGASLNIQGDGTLKAYGNAKNAIKGGETSTITVSAGTLNLNAANNGLAADGAVIIKGGTLNITAANDGIKSSPDEDDTESAGIITIYDGTMTIDAESDGINAAGDIAIYGGTFTIDAQSDGIQTDSNLTISDGTFNITTLNGYNSSGFDSDTMSCKGLKASASDDTTEATNTITITGGTFTLNTADDAIHSDAYIEITGGTFDIQTGDDGAHADTSLILGTDGGTVARDPDMTIRNSYEGLEAGTVYLYSGRYYVMASDDGINAAGGSGSGSDPGGPGGGGMAPGGTGGDHFNPGGGGPGGRAMMFGGFRRDSQGAGLLADSAYSINIAGGSVYVNAEGDGLDSNGDLTLTGGKIEVWGQYNRDNEPLDYDGTLTVNGATVFAAGSAGMGMASPSGGSQSYQNFSNSYSSGAVIVVSDGSNTVYNAQAPKNVNYVFFSAPNVTSPTLSTGSSVDCQYGNSWAHAWDDGEVTTAATDSASGLRTYTCSVCGETETETIPQLVSISEDTDDSGDTGDSGDSEADSGYVVTFVADDCIINVYYTHDYTTADEDGVTSTVSRNSDTGQPDSSGDGQVNFTALPPDGYTIEESDISIEGTYKALKGPDDTGVYSTWRITKVASDLTVTITPSVDSDSGDSGDSADTGDSGDSADTGDSGSSDSGDSADTGDNGNSGDTGDTGDSGDSGNSSSGGSSSGGNASDSSGGNASDSSGGASSGGNASGTSGGGCYVATSVYGSYDCPEVWTLRRFRDTVLAETWYGRLFIRAYYAVSPTVVRLFGDAAWFRDFWRGQLDTLITNLQEDGFESTPYEDKAW